MTAKAASSGCLPGCVVFIPQDRTYMNCTLRREATGEEAMLADAQEALADMRQCAAEIAGADAPKRSNVPPEMLLEFGEGRSFMVGRTSAERVRVLNHGDAATALVARRYLIGLLRSSLDESAKPISAKPIADRLGGRRREAGKKCAKRLLAVISRSRPSPRALTAAVERFYDWTWDVLEGRYGRERFESLERRAWKEVGFSYVFPSVGGWPACVDETSVG